MSYVCTCHLVVCDACLINDRPHTSPRMTLAAPTIDLSPGAINYVPEPASVTINRLHDANARLLVENDELKEKLAARDEFIVSQAVSARLREIQR
jgi:hypothetical protein